MLVMVVDDNRGVREMLLDCFTAQGHECVGAIGGQAAFDTIRTLLGEGEKVGAIVSDLEMPNGGGLELHGNVARHWPELATRMVFMTGGPTWLKEQVREETGRPVFSKPFSPLRMLEVVSSLLPE